MGLVDFVESLGSSIGSCSMMRMLSSSASVDFGCCCCRGCVGATGLLLLSLFASEWSSSDSESDESVDESDESESDESESESEVVGDLEL